FKHRNYIWREQHYSLHNIAYYYQNIIITSLIDYLSVIWCISL
ncbi:hypothetical protein BACFIN_07203, partial [Bacteroides finegoldii DSM 17565]